MKKILLSTMSLFCCDIKCMDRGDFREIRPITCGNLESFNGTTDRGSQKESQNSSFIGTSNRRSKSVLGSGNLHSGYTDNNRQISSYRSEYQQRARLSKRSDSEKRSIGMNDGDGSHIRGSSASGKLDTNSGTEMELSFSDIVVAINPKKVVRTQQDEMVTLNLQDGFVSLETFNGAIQRFNEKLDSVIGAFQREEVALGYAISLIEEANRGSGEQIILMANEKVRAMQASISQQCATEIKHRNDLHQMELQNLQMKLDAERTRRKDAETEKDLVVKICRIVSDCRLNPRTGKISLRSSDVLKMDVITRYNTISEIYEKKFLPFRELLIVKELQVINRYITSTVIDTHNPIRKIEVNVSNVGAWGEPTVNQAQYDRMISLHQEFFGYLPAHHYGNWAEHGIVHMAGGHKNRNGWWRFDGDQGITAAGSRVNTELEKRYQKAKTDYDAQFTQASSIVFPSVIFDNLACKINDYLGKLI